jgi:hypothetical protein
MRGAAASAAALTAILLLAYLLTGSRVELLLAAAAAQRRLAAWPESRTALITLAAHSASCFLSTALNAYLRPGNVYVFLTLALNSYLLLRVVAEAFGGLRGDGGLLAAAVALASLSYIAYLVSVFEVVF